MGSPWDPRVSHAAWDQNDCMDIPRVLVRTAGTVHVCDGQQGLSHRPPPRSPPSAFPPQTGSLKGGDHFAICCGLHRVPPKRYVHVLTSVP